MGTAGTSCGKAYRESFVTQTATSPLDATRPATTGAGPVTLHLNAFQMLMFSWAKLGAYNAGQVMQVSGHADLDRWQNAVEGAVHDLGLGIPQFNQDGNEVRFAPVDSIHIQRVRVDWATYVNEEINRSFDKNEFPIRFAVLERDDGSHYFCAFYDHWIGDSRAMRELMHRIFARYQSPDGPLGLPRLVLAAPPFEKLFQKRLGQFKLWAMLRQSVRNMRRHVFAHRINLIDPVDFTSHCINLVLPEGLIQQVRQKAKSQNASVNDFFLAVLGQVMGEYTAKERYFRKRRHCRRRSHVGLGTIVDIRDAAAENLDNVFGLYLSSYTTILRKPERMPINRLLANISRGTRRVKKTFASVRAYSGLIVARFWWDTYGDARWKAQMFHRHVPVVAGISNVNLTGSWMDQCAESSLDGPVVLDYLRISPTGPLLPLVFTLTTLREQLSLCVTYRTTAFTRRQVEDLAEQFVHGLQEAVQ
jgi:NRPS condensation-like uncharacterized protein